MVESMATIIHDGQEIEVELTNCVLHMDGHFAGNLDFIISFDHEVDIDQVRGNLRLRDEHGRDMMMKEVGFSGDDDRYDITVKWPVDPAPTAIQFHWRQGNVELAAIPVKEVRVSDYDDSERFERSKAGGCLTAIALSGGFWTLIDFFSQFQ